MLCSTCGNDCRVEAKFCPHCGAALTTSASPLDGISEELATLQEELNDDLKEATSSLDEELEKLTSSLGATGVPADSGQKFAPPAEAVPLVHPQEWDGLLKPRAESIRQSAGFVFDSPFIQGNAQYKARVDQVTFSLLLEESMVNAFATDQAVPLPDGKEVKPPAILFLGGLGTSVRLAAAALAAHIRCRHDRSFGRRRSPLAETFDQMGKAIAGSGGNLELATALRILKKSVLPRVQAGEERFVSLARSYAATMDMFVVAHEAGHVALAHTLGQAHNYDVSRNQEREADSFAGSALSTSPFREYLFLGQVFVTLIFSWVEHAAHAGNATTHPLSRERFLSAFQSNSEAAREVAQEFGLSREKLAELLPAEAR